MTRDELETLLNQLIEAAQESGAKYMTDDDAYNAAYRRAREIMRRILDTVPVELKQ